MPRLRRAAGWVATPLALLVLQLAFSMYYWDARPSAGELFAPTWEIIGLCGLVVAVGWRRRRRAVELPFKLGLTVLTVGFLVLGFAERFARVEFGYDVVLAIDLRYVPELFQMMFRADSLWRSISNCLVIVAVVVLAVLSIHFAIVRLHAVAGDPLRRRRLCAGFVAAVLAASLLFGIKGPLTAIAYEQLDVALHRQQRVRLIAKQMEHDVEAARGTAPFKMGSWHPDIFVFVVESYGGALYEQAQFAGFRDFIARESAQLTQAGFSVRSRYLTSPVFGGSSWMADASLLCGVRVNNQRRYEGLKAAAIDCLPEMLNAAGYNTVFAAGNTTFADLDFRRLFPFKRMFLRGDFAYQGPRFAWSFIPDQYVIDRVDRREVAPRGAGAPPLFAFYMLTSSHHPWSEVPPYVIDWNDLGDGSIFAHRPGLSFPGNEFVSGTQYAEGFDASTRYALHTVFAYLKKLPHDQAPIIIVLGDHQPRHPVAEMRHDAWSVPVHVISRDPQALERLTESGYTAGMTPGRDGAPLPFERFLDRLLVVLSADGLPAAP